jgi:hypothetical protein
MTTALRKTGLMSTKKHIVGSGVKAYQVNPGKSKV